MSQQNTPIGEASFSDITKPRAFKADAKEKYAITLLLDKGSKECNAFLKAHETARDVHIAAYSKKSGKKEGKDFLVRDPYHEEDVKEKDETSGKWIPTGEKTGKIAIKFTSAQRPSVYDAFGKKFTPPSDWILPFGSKVIVAYAHNPWDMNNGTAGLSFYFNGLQIVEMSEAGSDCEFEPVDGGGFEAEAFEPEPSSDGLDAPATPDEAKDAAAY